MHLKSCYLVRFFLLNTNKFSCEKAWGDFRRKSLRLLPIRNFSINFRHRIWKGWKATLKSREMKWNDRNKAFRHSSYYLDKKGQKDRNYFHKRTETDVILNKKGQKTQNILNNRLKRPQLFWKKRLKMINSFNAIVKLQNFSKNVALFSKPNYMNENMLLLSILYLLVFLCFNVDLTFVDICLFRCKTHVPTKQKDPTGIFLILFCFSKVTV